MKIDRLLGIVLLLLKRRKMTAPELASHFEVSVRTIYRDIQSIEAAGIPIASSNGVSGGFEILESYCLERQLFSPEDMLSILNALKSVEMLGDAQVKRTKTKLERLMPGTVENERCEELYFELSPWGDVSSVMSTLKLLQCAVKERQCVRFAYQGGDRTFTDREVEPMTLVYKGSAWYVFGYCRLRCDYRLFRLSRIRHCVAQPERFARRDGTYETYAKLGQKQAAASEVSLHLRFDREARFMVEDTFFPNQMSRLADGATEVRASIPDGEWLCSWLLSFGGYVEVLSPTTVREKLAAHAKRLWQKNAPVD
ncbi:MAG: YafY family transcriptional regulator [Deltaproteobacteria bacterium]|nr:YafY family transcriptional regulator [Deltaproteobacteria bacterium]